jgi:hypothetical protein
LELPNDVFRASLFEDRKRGCVHGEKISRLKEYDKADLLTLLHLSQYYNVEIDDPMFIAEVQSLESDMQNFVKDESLNEDELRERIEKVVKWAKEIRQGLFG